MSSIMKLRAEMLRSWRSWIGGVARAVKKLLPDAEIYIIGSIAEGKATAASDLDLLIVSNSIPRSSRKLAELKVAIEDEAKLPVHHPVEFHFTTPEEAQQYLKRSRALIKLS